MGVTGKKKEGSNERETLAAARMGGRCPNSLLRVPLRAACTYMLTGAWLPPVLRRVMRLGSSTPDMPLLDMRCKIRRGAACR